MVFWSKDLFMITMNMNLQYRITCHVMVMGEDLIIRGMITKELIDDSSCVAKSVNASYKRVVFIQHVILKKKSTCTT